MDEITTTKKESFLSKYKWVFVVIFGVIVIGGAYLAGSGSWQGLFMTASSTPAIATSTMATSTQTTSTSTSKSSKKDKSGKKTQTDQ